MSLIESSLNPPYCLLITLNVVEENAVPYSFLF